MPGDDVVVGAGGGSEWGVSESVFIPEVESWVVGGVFLPSSSLNQTPELCRERARRAELWPRLTTWPR